MKYLIILSLFNFQNLFSQSLNENVINNLPSVLNESSGLERDAEGNFWSHNDSGGDPELYHFSEDGTLLHTLRISNGENIDWEDIALTSDGRLLIGDFGNNSNDREDSRPLHHGGHCAPLADRPDPHQRHCRGLAI
jgi:sugar lactone lactonase YvrE